MDAATVEGLHASLGRTGVIVLDEAVVEALCSARQSLLGTRLKAVMAAHHRWGGTAQMRLTDGALEVLSGIILTLWTWPVVSKIWRRTSSVTRGSSPPTYRARLLGSGAARRGV